ncbi:protein kinase C and casein kinase substrate in neurons protein 2 isoform X2 [Aplysia californica]|uniref:Protein kinase C and casein kinase substrate in neurons protein 2 isoform X2 n=1 Tax=Aplysia californica TaxID=6500 RepID=A0ABM0JVK8_APLCA|nr:protein kinase C and casein kinase substrate in neurons protein 2 isoform X2 [Aplysia californica]
MSVNDDAVMSGSDSFWEVGKYMRTVKRCDNGYQLCNHLKRLIEERSEIEKKYSAVLSEWAKKWNNFLDKGPEYGTTQGAWRGLLTEADHVADLHTNMAEKMMFEVHGSIKVWQKENYHKSMMHFKETKEFEDNFRKAQKPWGKRLSKVMVAKKEYHSACRTEKSTANQENNARGDTTVSQDQLKKLQDKLRKCQQEVEATREKYNAAVNDLNGYNAKYIEDMTEVYSRCQDFEQKRIDFFKKTLFQLHSCLDLSVESRYSQIYTSLHATIGNMDPNKDLKWWSTNHGVDMAMHWPTFEEYSPELQQISKRGKSNLSSADGGIMITGIRHSREDSYGSYSNEPTSNQQQQQQQQQQQYQPYQQPNYNTQTSNNSYGAASNSAVDSQQDSPVHEGENPFGDTDGDEGEPDVEDPPSQGWAVRALYDYVKAEDDELEFKAGDIFTQVATEDEMGWCKGQKGGQIGFYPKNYVERI